MTIIKPVIRYGLPPAERKQLALQDVQKYLEARPLESWSAEQLEFLVLNFAMMEEVAIMEEGGKPIR